jgi:hypothetical protein
MKHKLRFRQVHMDFHTSEHIPDIGANFDAKQFAKTLYDAKVNSVTCFARCHHGWLYYNSKNMPEIIHPNLKNKNLLNQQIEACHEYDIKVPVYTTVQWDDMISKKHYDWLVLNENGGPFKQMTFQPGFYRNLCLNSPYVDYFKAHIKDIFQSIDTPLDGLFLDILNLQPCACPRCVAEMQSMGIDAEDREKRFEFAIMVMDRFKRDITKFIHDIQPDCPVFYNAGHIGVNHKNALETFTHLEIESLPGGYWGYDHFPATARYTRTLGLDFMGMTGKFHTDWGDFSSFKNQPALEYECFKSLAYTGKCSVGDQLSPDGRISAPVYDLIGKVYSQVEQKEPWCEDAKPVNEAAIFLPEEYISAGSDLMTSDLIGAVKMLTELGLQFDVIDSTSDISGYKLLILPDNIPVNKTFEAVLSGFVKDGGSIIASYKSGLKPDESDFIDLFGVEKVGYAPYSPDFIVAEGDIAQGLYNTEYVMYLKAMQVALKKGAHQLIKTNVPYFNRTWEHFCSHKHTPSSGEYGYPAVVGYGNVVYFAHPIFTQYKKNAPKWVKILVSNAIDMLLDKRIIRHDGPSTLEADLNIQYDRNRYVLHLLHYIPERRTETMDIIEDIIPLYNIGFAVNVDKEVTDVKLIPQNIPVEFTKDGSMIRFTIPEIRGHQMVEFGYIER